MASECSTIREAKTKTLISFAVTAKPICVFVFAYPKPICVFVFAYAKNRFSHNEAQLCACFYSEVSMSRT